MKKHEIEAIFTAKVQEYIAKGYTISTTTMSGHQGEIAKIDVTNGEELIRILLEGMHEWNHEDRREIEAVVLTVFPSRFWETNFSASLADVHAIV